MTIHLGESTKPILLAIASRLETRANADVGCPPGHTVRRRKLNMLLVAEKLKTLANSKAVSVLLDYME